MKPAKTKENELLLLQLLLSRFRFFYQYVFFLPFALFFSVTFLLHAHLSIFFKLFSLPSFLIKLCTGSTILYFVADKKREGILLRGMICINVLYIIMVVQRLDSFGNKNLVVNVVASPSIIAVNTNTD